MNVHIRKLVSVTTDGAPAMTREHVGVIGLCRNNPFLPGGFSYHCAIDQRALRTKLIDFQQAASDVQTIVNSIRAGPLQTSIRTKLMGLMET
jgi:hypothetical protein